jgi:hypothetical protein
MRSAIRKSLFPIVSFASMTLVVGCGGSDGPTGEPVAGKVLLDGRPIESGRIVLSHVDGKSAAVGEIKGGEFRLRPSDGAVPGSYRVSIHAEKKTGKTVPHPDLYGQKIEEIVEAVPSHYNVNTKLTAEIKADEDNALEFALASAVAKPKPTRRRR